MGVLADIFSKSPEYKEAVAKRQLTGRLTTGGTGYSDRQTRGLQFAQDVARGWTAQAIGDSMTGNQNAATTAIQAAKTAQAGVAQNNAYDTLNSLDEAQKRSEGLQVAEANEQEKQRADNALGIAEGLANTAQQGFQLYAGNKLNNKTEAKAEPKAEPAWDKNEAQQRWNSWRTSK